MLIAYIPRFQKFWIQIGNSHNLHNFIGVYLLEMASAVSSAVAINL